MRRIGYSLAIAFICGTGKLEWLGYNLVKVARWSTQSFGHNTSTWQTHIHTDSHVAIAITALTHCIDVKKRFYVFLFWLRFYVFNVFLFFKRFLFLKNVGKVQSGKQINKKHFQNNSNETDLWFFCCMHVEWPEMPFYKLKTILVTVTVTWSCRNERFLFWEAWDRNYE